LFSLSWHDVQQLAHLGTQTIRPAAGWPMFCLPLVEWLLISADIESRIERAFCRFFIGNADSTHFLISSRCPHRTVSARNRLTQTAFRQKAIGNAWPGVGF
jgi:hypothetical protein